MEASLGEASTSVVSGGDHANHGEAWVQCVSPLINQLTKQKP